MTSYNMVKSTLEDLKLNARDFSNVKHAADTFVLWANNKFDGIDENDLQVNEHLPQVRKKK